MDRNRLLIIGAVLAMVVVVVLGWIVGVQPQLAIAASDNQNRTDVQTQNAASETALAGLKKDYARMGELKKQRAALREAIPQGTDMSAFIDELHALEITHHVSLTSFTVNDGQPYVRPKPPASATPDATATPAPTATPTPTATPGATPKAPKLPKVNKNNFTLMPIQVQVTGKYSDVLDFVDGLQTGTRLTLVTTLSTAPSTGTGKAGDVDATIGGFVYVLNTAKAADTSTK